MARLVQSNRDEPQFLNLKSYLVKINLKLIQINLKHLQSLLTWLTHLTNNHAGSVVPPPLHVFFTTRSTGLVFAPVIYPKR